MVPPSRRSDAEAPPRLRFEQKTLAYLARRERTAAQVRAFLARVGAPSDIAGTILHELSARGYLNDADVAERWVTRRLTRHPMGRARLEAELRARGIDVETARRAIEAVLAGESERERAARLLARRAPTKGGGRARAAALLRRYGFEEDVIESLARDVEE